MALAAQHGVALERRGNNDSWGCCPFHKEKTASFHIRKNRYKCFGCGASGDAIDFLQMTRGLKFHDAVEELAGRPRKTYIKPSAHHPPSQVAHNPPSQVDHQRMQRPLEIWEEGRPITGTPVETYLASRSVSYQGEALRWHSSCPFGESERCSCMIGLVRNIVTNQPQAIHRTALDANSRKIGRMALGPIGGGAIKLTADADVTGKVAIGEGLETTLSIRELHMMSTMPIWCVLNADGIAKFPALPGIGTVWIAADNDSSGTGQRAARAAAARLSEAGVDVEVVTPTRVGGDFNDVVRRYG